MPHRPHKMPGAENKSQPRQALIQPKPLVRVLVWVVTTEFVFTLSLPHLGQYMFIILSFHRLMVTQGKRTVNQIKK